MLRKVWKYKIEKEEMEIPIPATDVKPLFILCQRDKDMQSTPVYTFYGLMTGQDVPVGATYIGSCQIQRTVKYITSTGGNQ